MEPYLSISADPPGPPKSHPRAKTEWSDLKAFVTPKSQGFRPFPILSLQKQRRSKERHPRKEDPKREESQADLIAPRTPPGAPDADPAFSRGRRDRRGLDPHQALRPDFGPGRRLQGDEPRRTVACCVANREARVFQGAVKGRIPMKGRKAAWVFFSLGWGRSETKPLGNVEPKWRPKCQKWVTFRKGQGRGGHRRTGPFFGGNFMEFPLHRTHTPQRTTWNPRTTQL